MSVAVLMASKYVQVTVSRGVFCGSALQNHRPEIRTQSYKQIRDKSKNDLTQVNLLMLTHLSDPSSLKMRVLSEISCVICGNNTEAFETDSITANSKNQNIPVILDRQLFIRMVVESYFLFLEKNLSSPSM